MLAVQLIKKIMKMIVACKDSCCRFWGGNENSLVIVPSSPSPAPTSVLLLLTWLAAHASPCAADLTESFVASYCQ